VADLSSLSALALRDDPATQVEQCFNSALALSSQSFISTAGTGMSSTAQSAADKEEKATSDAPGTAVPISSDQRASAFTAAAAIALSRASPSMLLRVLEHLLPSAQASSTAAPVSTQPGRLKQLLSAMTQFRSDKDYTLPWEGALISELSVDGKGDNGDNRAPWGGFNKKHVVPDLASDGEFLYIHDNGGLRKVGTGLRDSDMGRVYATNDGYRQGERVFLAFVVNKLYAFSQRSASAVVDVINPTTLDSEGVLHLGKATSYLRVHVCVGV